MQKLKRIAVAVVEHKNRFLVGVRAPNDSLAGFHEFPGGKIELEESPQQAAVRECLEESGVQVVAVGMYSQAVHHYEHASVELNFVACAVEQISDPKHGFQWMDRHSLKDCTFPAGNLQLLLELRTNVPPQPLN
tara:strand:- start:942 stop:1343 length:402 start_codon:yes stop_codon:yes gene_type:complete